MGRNLTGLANPQDYLLGRGRVYAALIAAATGLPIAFRFLGNAPQFSVTTTAEVLKHKASTHGLKVTDKEVTISQECDVKFQLDEINHENLADFFSGEEATHTNVSVAGFTIWEMVTAGTIQKGRYYEIRNSAGARAYDVDSTKLTLATTNGTPVTLVIGTDYTVDSEMGLVFLLSTSTRVATAISGNEGIDATLTADAGAVAVHEVRALTQSAVRVALKFISENASDEDRQTEFQFHQISLKPDGDFSLISDEFTVMGFTGASEQNTLASSNSPTLTIREVQIP